MKQGRIGPGRTTVRTAVRLAGERPDRERSPRQRRVGEALRHALSTILRDGECRDPALRDVSITVSEVRISPDLRNATVFVMPLGGANAAEALAGLERCAGFLQGRVARELTLRLAPHLAFTLDPAFDQAAQIGRLLALPEVARDLGPRSLREGRAAEGRGDAG
jgi:ribosome-binding factor A